MGCRWSKCCENYEAETKSQTYSDAPTRTFKLEQTNNVRVSKPMPVSQTFEKDCLAEHNRLRALHGAPPLELDDGMNRFAKDWARQLADQKSLQHRPNNKYGENIYWASGKNATAKDVVGSWYNEINNYNFNKPGFSMKTGHFTQVVWKSSKRLGVGIEKRGNATYVVANYDPPGNYTNQYKENVLPKKK